ncbi:2,3-bisphosphoglycerate-dependent phosphoglycerate mutase [Cryomorpha ignava]|uniref:2,3-bisphosphoglycerate-dependent phosphoglycerate mutase n=1 Tax=Cryomorpha ignava TaxID=101383 RepID=A0A7K3WS22_9FLAO|nr:2,3-bisphosphoglycerate-dependent phosphoglycerate mutase [Cryomorpha ignava]NEN23505.1 2,3-bisphosphoglycerate-dependent phosphoglycerate mutase [Cryomorpha ignava]
MSKLVIVRHGQSEWNKANIFTGWVDVDLTEEGVAEAKRAGELLKEYNFDEAFSSTLKRANRTLDIILKEIDQTNIPVTHSEKLNERMYGDLQGKNKDQAREEFGEEQVHIWRRSFDVPPPGGESLKDTLERVTPYFESVIEPELRKGKDILITAHGNSLRSLIMKLENIAPENIVSVEIPTGVPKVYELDENLKVLSSKFLK